MNECQFKKKFDSNNKSLQYKQRIIQHIIYNGPETLPALAQRLEVSVPTISKMVNEMVDTHLLQNFGKLEAASGRHPFLYGLSDGDYYFIGVDFTVDTTNIMVMNLRGDQVQEKLSIPFDLVNTQECLDAACRMINDFIDDECHFSRDKLVSIGVNIPGRLNPMTGYSYTYFNFSKISLSKYLSLHVGIPTFIDNDSRASAFGEYMTHYKDSGKNLLFVQCTWGLGLGIIINGEPYAGKSGFSGEVGHTHAYSNEVICHCGKKGCLETEVSGSAIHRKFIEKIKTGAKSILTDPNHPNGCKDINHITLNDIVQAVLLEDILCIEIIEEMGKKLGLHIANLINLLNPDIVVIGGPLARTGDYLLQPIRTTIRKYSLNMVNQDTDLKQSLLMRYAGVMGAAMLARKKSIEALTYKDNCD
ncbi:ROK family protein [Porphyromonadaceae bacterium W3.11]|nr:ROK family protein [Porphyromonadaceae bacterium W3.11]